MLLESWLASTLTRRRSPSQHEWIDGRDWSNCFQPLLAPKGTNNLDKSTQRRASATLEISQSANADTRPR
ncbi:hypothetical protein CBM2585_A10073 [Cupriavidus taiwanensis]|nr:hypothetical protein CBM2585_A10073 [Cupriavidus taiwanensis]